MPGEALPCPADCSFPRFPKLQKVPPIIWRQHSGISKRSFAEGWSPADLSFDSGFVFVVSWSFILNHSTAETGMQAERIRSESAAGALDVAQQRVAGIVIEAAIRLKQILQPRPGTVQPDLGGFGRDSQHVGNLTVLHAFGFAQQ